MFRTFLFTSLADPKDPAVLKILRRSNLLSAKGSFFLPSLQLDCDKLELRTWCVAQASELVREKGSLREA